MGSGTVYTARWLGTRSFSTTSPAADATDQPRCATLLHVSKTLTLEALHRIRDMKVHRNFSYPTYTELSRRYVGVCDYGLGIARRHAHRDSEKSPLNLHF